jgi:hypothetical protein
MTAPANPYEAACERFNRASRRAYRAKADAERILREADAEYEAALANLAQYESEPGIALPQYREAVRIPFPPGVPGLDGPLYLHQREETNR